MQAIIYARFSDTAQSTGDSIARQLRACKPFVAAKGWELDRIVTDDGKSGWKAHHRSKGEMGNLEREARDGLHVGKVLVVEQLSRLSREDHNETYDFVRALTKNGVSIATVEGDRFYEAYKGIEFGAVIELIVRAQMYHEESASKSRHGLAKWEARRAAMKSGRVATKLCPPWLEVKPDRSGFIVLEDRAEVVRQIFQWADEGLGSLRILKKLKAAGHAPFERYAKRGPKGWSRGTLTRMLQNQAVVGDYQPMRMVADKRVPVGEVVRGYFPRIVEPDLFARVCAAAEGRKTVRGNKGEVSNLFAGLVKCESCGSVMVYRRHRSAGAVVMRDGKPAETLKSASSSLVCNHAVETNCPNTRFIAYQSVEKAMLKHVLHLALDDDAFARRDEVARLDIQIADKQRDHDATYARAVELWEVADSQIAQTIARKKETEAAEIAAELTELKLARQRAAGKVSAAEQLSRLDAIRDDLKSEDVEVRTKARTKVAQGFRAIVSEMTGHASGSVTVSLMDGRHKLKIIPQRGRREPEVWDFDFVHPARPDSEAGNAKVEAYLARSAKAKAA